MPPVATSAWISAGVVFVLTGLLVAMLAWTWADGGGADGSDDSDGGNGGWGRARHPRRPPPGGPVTGSWEDFERQFADYVASGAGRAPEHARSTRRR